MPMRRKSTTKFKLMNNIQMLTDEQLLQKNNENKQIKKIHELKDLPFTIVEFDNQYFVALGKYRLSHMFKSIQKAREDARKITWTRLIQVIHIIQQETQNTKTPQ